jgi:methylmalonyl-CoA mutase cobalamin-binding subunit
VETTTFEDGGSLVSQALQEDVDAVVFGGIGGRRTAFDPCHDLRCKGNTDANAHGQTAAHVVRQGLQVSAGHQRSTTVAEQSFQVGKQQVFDPRVHFTGSSIHWR